MDSRQLDATMIWALVLSLLCLSGVLHHAVSGVAWGLGKVRRYRLRRRNLGVVRRIQALQGIMESGADRK
jgi:hypothetical protein